MAKAKRPALGQRLRWVLGLSLLLSLPAFLINLLVQGGKEFQPEIEAYQKYRKIINKIKRKG